MTKNMGEEFLLGKMGGNMMENGRRESSTAKEGTTSRISQ